MKSKFDHKQFDSPLMRSKQESNDNRNNRPNIDSSEIQIKPRF